MIIFSGNDFRKAKEMRKKNKDVKDDRLKWWKIENNQTKIRLRERERERERESKKKQVCSP